MNNKKIRVLAYMAMLIALEVVLEFINRVIPQMPQGGTVSFCLVPIFLAAYLLGTKEGLLVGFCSSLLLFVFGLATFWGWWSVALDYVIPLTVCGFAGAIKSIKLANGYELPIGIIFAMVLKFISHYLSGAVLFASYAPEGQSPYLYSLLYNAPYNIVTMIVCFILVMLLLPKFKKVVRV